jgi:hypothetical protein
MLVFIEEYSIRFTSISCTEASNNVIGFCYGLVWLCECGVGGMRGRIYKGLLKIMDQFGLSIIQDEEALKNSLIFILCFRAFVAVFFARTREKINRLWTGLSNRAAWLTKVQFLKRGNCGDKNGFISNFSNAICFLLST